MWSKKKEGPGMEPWRAPALITLVKAVHVEKQNLRIIKKWMNKTENQLKIPSNLHLWRGPVCQFLEILNVLNDTARVAPSILKDLSVLLAAIVKSN